MFHLIPSPLRGEGQGEGYMPYGRVGGPADQNNVGCGIAAPSFLIPNNAVWIKAQRAGSTLKPYAFRRFVGAHEIAHKFGTGRPVPYRGQARSQFFRRVQACLNHNAYAFCRVQACLNHGKSRK